MGRQEPPSIDDDQAAIDHLVSIMRKLRSDDGCPWDREQTLQTLKENLIEEAYEVIDAIDGGDRKLLEEELGDLLLQVVFQAQLCEEEGAFNFDDVARHICEKLIRRHTHVFGDVKAESADEALKNWNAMKAQEKEKGSASALDGVPKHLPALAQAQKLQKKAAKVGFDWDELKDVMAKVDEEWAELKAAIDSGDHDHAVEELGDVLFAITNVGRFVKCDVEDALRGTNRKFERRFKAIEARLREQGRKPEECTLAELDAIWNQVKATER